MLISHVISAIEMPPDHIVLADIQTPPAPPEPPPPLPHFEPVAPHVVMPSVSMPVVATPPPPNAITLPPAPPPSPVAQPGPVTPPAPAAPPPDYLARLMARLNAAKDYPRAAQDARIQGVVLVHFTMDRQGRVLSFAVQKSSGIPLLDRGAQNTVMRAQPLPPVPPDFPGETLTLTLPIDFHFKR